MSDFATFQGRVVEVIGRYGSPDGENHYVKIRDGNSITDVFQHQLGVYTPPSRSDAPTLAAIYINQIQSHESLILIPTVQVTSAKKILSRRPEKGYADFEQMESLNKDLTRVDWNAVRPLLRFDYAAPISPEKPS